MKLRVLSILTLLSFALTAGLFAEGIFNDAVNPGAIAGFHGAAGGVSEQLGQQSFSVLKNRVFYFDGGVKGLRNYMAVMSNAVLFVGPSTGTTHLANILGVKVVTIYSPIKVQASLRWGPFFRDSKKARVIVPDVVCGEKFQCAGSSCLYYECMGKIEVDEVFESIQQLLIDKKL